MKFIEMANLSTKRRKAVIFVIAMMIAIPSFMLGSVLGVPGGTWADTPTYVGPGSMLTEASYIIFKDDSGAICAKNGESGRIDYRSSNASSVIQSALNAMTEGGKLLIRNGIYSITAPMTISNSYVTIEGENYASYDDASHQDGGVFLRANFSSYVFIADASVNEIHSLQFHNLVVENFNGGGFYLSVYGNYDSGFRSPIFTNVKVMYTSYWAYYIDDSHNLQMNNAMAESCNNGVSLNHCMQSSITSLYSGVRGNAGTSLYFNDSFANSVSGFWGGVDSGADNTGTSGIWFDGSASSNVINLVDIEQSEVALKFTGNSTSYNNGNSVQGGYIGSVDYMIQMDNYAYFNTFSGLTIHGYVAVIDSPAMSSLHNNILRDSSISAFPSLTTVSVGHGWIIHDIQGPAPGQLNQTVLKQINPIPLGLNDVYGTKTYIQWPSGEMTSLPAMWYIITPSTTENVTIRITFHYSDDSVKQKEITKSGPYDASLVGLDYYGLIIDGKRCDYMYVDAKTNVAVSTAVCQILIMYTGV